MKNILLVLIALIFYQISAVTQPCLPQGYTFTTQEEIDNFQTNYPNCTEIEGDVNIGLNWNSTDISNLEGLNVVTSIGGSLHIRSNPALTSLAGLNNLTSIGGSLHIWANHALTSLIGLDNIDAASIESLHITVNDSLSTCEVQSVCDYLVSPNGSVNIYSNASGCNNPAEVANACGITLPCLPFGNYYFSTQAQIDSFQINYPNCTEIEGNLKINGGDITNLNGLNVLISIEGSLWIDRNDFLTSLTGLNNVTYIGENLRIYNNYSLTSLTGFENLNSIEGYVFICDNDTLKSLTGLNNLTSIEGILGIQSNNSLTSLTGLENLTSIEGILRIASNNSLTSLTGLENLTYTRDLIIGGSGMMMGWGNPSLISLTGLDNLGSIGGLLRILGNTALISLTGLSNLTSIGGDVIISDNDALSSLTGLDNIDAASIDDLRIMENNSLSTCEVQSICNYLASPNGAISINNNAPGCNSQQEVEQACPTISVEELELTGQLSLHPNPFFNAVTIEYKLASPGITEVNIYNQIGQVIKEFVHQESREGINKLIWQTEDIPSGIYFIRLQIGNEIITKKIIKL